MLIFAGKKLCSRSQKAQEAFDVVMEDILLTGSYQSWIFMACKNKSIYSIHITKKNPVVERYAKQSQTGARGGAWPPT